MAATTDISYGNLNTLLSVTLPARVKQRMENYFRKENVFLALATSRGKIRQERMQGNKLTVPLGIGGNTTVKTTDGKATSTPAVQETTTTGEWPWAIVQGNVALYQVDMRQNSGTGRLLDYVQTQVDATLEAIKDKINTQIVDKGSAEADATDTVLVQGLKDAVGCNTAGAFGAATTAWGPTLYGGVSMTDFSTWQSVVYNSNGLASLLGDMNRTWNKITGGKSSTPDVILTDEEGIALYGDKVQTYLQLSDQKVGDGSFAGYTFKGKPVLFDANLTLGGAGEVTDLLGSADTASTHRFYFLSGESWRIYLDEEWNLENAIEVKPLRPTDSLMDVMPVHVGIQLVCVQRWRNGVLRNVPIS